MSVQTLESQREDPPREWVKLRKSEDDSFSEGDFAKAFCNFVDKFYWRPREEEPNELHVVFHKAGEENPRYRHFDVSKDVYDELWNRAYFPEDYNHSFGSWFSQNISNQYENERYKN